MNADIDANSILSSATAPPIMPSKGVNEHALSVDELCRRFIEYERAKHRYQWATCEVLDKLMRDPATPTKLSDFVDWLERETGLRLTQNDVTRRLAVYKTYAPFIDDAQVAGLIEAGGMHIAHRAKRVIKSSDDHEHVKTVLRQCVARPGALAETLDQYAVMRPRAGPEKPKQQKLTVRVSESALRERLNELADGDHRVVVDAVVGLLAELGGASK